MNGSAIALVALVPLITGPVPENGERVIVAQLCNGGTIAIPLGDGEQDFPAPCNMKGCHAGTCRKKLDSTQ